MRTVTFADLKLALLINRTTVPVWHNQNAQASGVWQRGVRRKRAQLNHVQVSAYPMGAGGGNIRTYFCTPGGQVVHYLQGYWSAEQYTVALRFAQRQHERLQQDPRALAPLKKQLTARISGTQQARTQLRKVHPAEFSKPVRLSKVRQREAALGLRRISHVEASKIIGKQVEPILAGLRKKNMMCGKII